jgi:hypothetical protein
MRLIIKATAAASVMLLAAAHHAAASEGYWRLDRTAFENDAGAVEWTGQAGMNIRLLSYDNEQIAIRESFRSDMSQTYVIGWQIPDVLIPGHLAPFGLSESCINSEFGSGWPHPNTKMAPTSLTADFNRDAYYQLAEEPCIPGAKVDASAPELRIPDGETGDTTRIVVSAGPTYYSSVRQIFYFSWVGGAPPSGATGGPPDEPTGGAAPPEPYPNAGPPWEPPTDNTGMEPLPPVADPVIVRNGAGGGVSPGAKRPTIFELDGDFLITQVITYHYAAGVAPGTIAIESDDGTLYGPWQAAGAVGSGGHANSYWWVQPNIVLPHGRYTVIDSDPSTWSTEAVTQGAGIVQIWGRRL